MDQFLMSTRRRLVRRLVLWVAILWVLGISGTVSVPAWSCELSIGWETWEPYEYLDDSGTLTGVDIDLVREIVDAVGCRASFRKAPWARMLAEVESGRIALLPAASFVAERTAIGRYTRAYRTEDVHLVQPVDKPAASLSELIAGAARIGVTREYYYGPEVERLQADPTTAARFVTGDTDRANLLHLDRGRLDAVLVDFLVARSLMRIHELSARLVIAAQPVYRADIHILTSRASVDDALLTRLDQAIGRLEADQRLQGILRRYRGD